MPGAVQECPQKKKKEPEQKPELHWVEFTLKDDKGALMADVVVKVKLPDGKFHEATLGKNGVIRINNVKAGNCTLELKYDGLLAYDTVFLQ